VFGVGAVRILAMLARDKADLVIRCGNREERMWWSGGDGGEDGEPRWSVAGGIASDR
jgi:hypothetical protein